MYMLNNPFQMIQKGVITKIEDEPVDRNNDKTTARVMPNNAEGIVTRPLTIPWWLRGRMGLLEPGTEVVYTLFEDATGVILSRMDGDWPGIVPGNVEILGTVTAVDFIPTQ